MVVRPHGNAAPRFSMPRSSIWLGYQVLNLKMTGSSPVRGASESEGCRGVIPDLPDQITGSSSSSTKVNHTFKRASDVFAGVAQSVELVPSKHQVVGSKPITRSRRGKLRFESASGYGQIV